jgi:hypothetical protein
VRTYEEIMDDARDGSPFSNGTEWEIWAANWCWAPCMNPVEAAWQRYEEGKGEAPEDFPGGCPLILAAMMGKTPIEWLEQPEDSPDRFHCIEFRDEEGDGGEPKPIPDDPDQQELFPRPEPQTRMLAPERIAELFDIPPELVGVNA